MLNIFGEIDVQSRSHYLDQDNDHINVLFFIQFEGPFLEDRQLSWFKEREGRTLVAWDRR